MWEKGGLFASNFMVELHPLRGDKNRLRRAENSWNKSPCFWARYLGKTMPFYVVGSGENKPGDEDLREHHLLQASMASSRFEV